MYSGETPNYQLPQYSGDDRMQPLADMNPAFLKIDQTMKANEQKFADITEMQNTISQIQRNIATIVSDINKLTASVGTANTTAINALNRAKNVGTTLSQVSMGLSTANFKIYKANTADPWGGVVGYDRVAGEIVLPENVHRVTLSINMTMQGSVNAEDELNFVTVLYEQGSNVPVNIRTIPVIYDQAGLGTIGITAINDMYFPLRQGKYYAYGSIFDGKQNIYKPIQAIDSISPQLVHIIQ